VEQQVLLESVRRALEKDRSSQQERHQLAEIARRFNSLTPREHQVLELVVSGRLNKQIGGQLGTCEKTIKVHRARVMKKMGVQSLAELVQLTIKLRSGSAALTTATFPRRGLRSR
jgi:FixJ family two-component response regulator